MYIRKLKLHEEPPYELLLTADPSREFVEEYLWRGECYMMEENQRIIGVYLILPTGLKTIEIVNIAVSESRQGLGYGKKLLGHAMERAKVKGYKTIEIGTGNSSLGQLSLYQKCGFRITGIDSDFFTQHYKEKIIENGIWCRDMIRLSMDLI